MKKLGLLVMPLLAVSLLASCGGGSTPTEDVKFSVQESSVTLSDNKATIHLDWTPSSNIIEFSNFTFTLKGQPGITTTVTPVEASSRPLELTITFKDELNENDTGDLKFHFNDKTAKKEGEKKIEGIGIKLPIYVKSWTASLDSDSEGFGDLSADGETGASVAIKEYIGLYSATISFIPNSGYEETEFIVTASDEKGSDFDVSYAAGETASIVISSNNVFEDGDKVTLYFEAPILHLIKFSGDNCVMKDENGDLVTESGTQVIEGVTEFYFEGLTEGDTEYLLPTRSQISVTYTDDNGTPYDDWTYVSCTGKISINIVADLTVEATADEDPGIPTETGKATLYFRLNSASVEMKEYESIFFAGSITEWATKTSAPEFTLLEGTNIYYLISDPDSWKEPKPVEEFNGYQLVKGYNAASEKPEEERGLIWDDIYKSLECRNGGNQLFDYEDDIQKISLDVHTFDANLIDPKTPPLSNCTLSITFDDQEQEGCPVLPVDSYTVLIFGSMNGWITPQSGQTVDERKEIYNAAKMTRGGGDSLTFTLTYDELYPGTYEFQICTELNTLVESGGMMTWHKIKEGRDIDPRNLQFTINAPEPGKSNDITIDILGEGNKAHFVEPEPQNA